MQLPRAIMATLLLAASCFGTLPHVEHLDLHSDWPETQTVLGPDSTSSEADHHDGLDCTLCRALGRSLDFLSRELDYGDSLSGLEPGVIEAGRQFACSTPHSRLQSRAPPTSPSFVLT